MFFCFSFLLFSKGGECWFKRAGNLSCHSNSISKHIFFKLSCVLGKVLFCNNLGFMMLIRLLLFPVNKILKMLSTIVMLDCILEMLYSGSICFVVNYKYLVDARFIYSLFVVVMQILWHAFIQLVVVAWILNRKRPFVCQKQSFRRTMIVLKGSSMSLPEATVCGFF